MKCNITNCLYYDEQMTDKCSKSEEPNVERCTTRLIQSRRYRIVSDGNPYNTKIYDPDGKELTNVRKAEFIIEADELSTLRLTFVNVQADITGELASEIEEIRKRVDNPNLGYDDSLMADVAIKTLLAEIDRLTMRTDD